MAFDDEELGEHVERTFMPVTVWDRMMDALHLSRELRRARLIEDRKLGHRPQRSKDYKRTQRAKKRVDRDARRVAPKTEAAIARARAREKRKAATRTPEQRAARAAYMKAARERARALAAAGVSLTKGERRCAVCGQPGHNARRHDEPQQEAA